MQLARSWIELFYPFYHLHFILFQLNFIHFIYTLYRSFSTNCILPSGWNGMKGFLWWFKKREWADHSYATRSERKGKSKNSTGKCNYRIVCDGEKIQTCRKAKGGARFDFHSITHKVKQKLRTASGFFVLYFTLLFFLPHSRSSYVDLKNRALECNFNCGRGTMSLEKLNRAKEGFRK